MILHVNKLLSPPLNKERKVTIFITLRPHGPYQGSLANKDSQNHLIFPISGILTRFEGGVTQVSTFLYSGEGIVTFQIHQYAPFL
jgi:hypothetical protein